MEKYMIKRNGKLYNVIFPIWLLWLIPVTWIVVLPANFLIDLLVVVMTMKALKIQDIKTQAKAVIFKTWIFGFAADFIGTAFMFLVNIIDFDFETPFGKWYYYNVSSAVCYDPFSSIYAILWIAACVGIAAFFIYLFNYKFSFKKSNLSDLEMKKLSQALAIFTAPYLFLLPTSWFF